MFKTPMNETDNEVDAALPRPYPPFFKFHRFALTSDFFLRFSSQFKRRVCPTPLKMVLVHDKQSFSTYTRN